MFHAKPLEALFFVNVPDLVCLILDRNANLCDNKFSGLRIGATYQANSLLQL